MSKRNIYYEDDNGDLESTGATGSSLVYTGPPKKIKTISAGTGITVTDNTTYLTITNSSTGDAVTLTSAGGTETLVNDGTGPALATKGITAGGGISLSSTATALTITNSSRASDATLTSAGGDYTLVNDGSGPDFAIKGITVSGGVTASADAVKVTLSSTAPTSLGANVAPQTNSATLSSNQLKLAYAGPSKRGVVYGTEYVSSVGFGIFCFENVAGGDENTGCGYEAGNQIVGGGNNTVMGFQAGYAVTSGTNNTCIGHTADVTSATATDRIAIGKGASSATDAYAALPTAVIGLSATGLNTINLGTSLPTTASAANLYYDTGTGLISRSTSSVVTKTNIRPVEIDTSKIMQIDVKEYKQVFVGDCYQTPGSVKGCDYCRLINLNSEGKLKTKTVRSHTLVLDNTATKVSSDDYESFSEELKSKVKIKEHLMIDDICIDNMMSGYIGESCPYHCGEKSKDTVGLVAEDFEAIGLQHLVQKDDNGKVMGIEYSCLTACLFNEVKKLRREVDVLKNQ